MTMTTQSFDVVIVGSGFGGSITAWRLAELYRAAGVDPGAIAVLERGRRYGHTDFRQSMDIDHLSDVYLLIQGEGMQVVAANAVGGGSNLYLAASLRAPTETFERRDRRPGDGPPRRMWPAAISRRTLDPYYARAEEGLRVKRPSWDQVSKSGGLWAATLHHAGHTCDRVPLAISEERCVNAKWCHTGCIFGAKNSLITNYLWAAEHAGVKVLPNVQVEQIAQTSARPYRYVVQADVMDNEGPNPSRMPTGQKQQFQCKVLVVAAGAMGTPVVLLRSRPNLPALSTQVGQHLGSNGDHVAAIEYDPARVHSVLGLPGYHEFYKGKPITTMSYDWFAGRPRPRLRRHPIHAPGDLPLDPDQLPLRQRPHAARRAVLVGTAEEAGRGPLEQADRAPGDGRGHQRRHLHRARPRRATPSAPTLVRWPWGPSTTPCPSNRRRCGQTPTR